jgi:hypothetical protein
MKRAAAAGANLIDVVAYPFITYLEAILTKNPKETWGKYENRIKIGGVKITIDGSPQGKTAFFTTRYLTGGPGGEKQWLGELSFPEAVITKAVQTVYAMDVPLNLHANGDAAIDAFLRAGSIRSLSQPRLTAAVNALLYAGTAPHRVGIAARNPGCCNRSDQLPQGAARLPHAPRDPLSAVVDAAGRHPCHSQQPGLADGHGAFCQAPPQEPQ